jgi:hypothetical protein
LDRIRIQGNLGDLLPDKKLQIFSGRKCMHSVDVPSIVPVSIRPRRASRT